MALRRRQSDTVSVNELTGSDAAYLAGLVDADGTVSLTRKHRNETRSVMVSISNTDRALLEFVRSTVGAGKLTNKRASGHNHRSSFVYSVYNRQALRLLERIAPFLKTYKARRARAILTHYVNLTPRNGKYDEATRRRRLAFERMVLGIRPDAKAGADST